MLRNHLGASFEQHGDAPALFFVGSDGEIYETITYLDALRAANSYAALIGSAAKPGDRVALLYMPGPDFIKAFLGCIFAGVIAVPVRPPTSSRTFAPFLRIIEDCEPTVIFAPAEIIAIVRAYPEGPASLRNATWFSFADTPPEVREWNLPPGSDEDIAVLQYTSGSTRDPRGVMLSNGNIQSNLRMCAEAFVRTQQQAVRQVTWLPLFHDMGLIGTLFDPLARGYVSYHLSPVDFIKDPLLWLRSISRYGGVSTGAPNFALELCVQRSSESERQQLNLSTLRLMVLGSEPLNYRTLDRFAAAFACSGFNPNAYCPGYGLAESTVLATSHDRKIPMVRSTFDGPELRRGRAIPVSPATPQAVTLIGCGHPYGGLALRVVNPDSLSPSSENDVGEIWIAGPNVSSGYWNKPAETQASFSGRLSGDDRTYLCTGDLGFFCNDHLFITGRLKDVIIIRGQNYYPSDIEAAIEAVHPGAGHNSTAAFAEGGATEERLVVLHEVASNPPDPAAVFALMRRTIAAEFEIQPARIVLLKPKSLLRTTSGKLRRSASRDALNRGELSLLAEWLSAPNTPEINPNTSEGTSSAYTRAFNLHRPEDRPSNRSQETRHAE